MNWELSNKINTIKKQARKLSSIVNINLETTNYILVIMNGLEFWHIIIVAIVSLTAGILLSWRLTSNLCFMNNDIICIKLYIFYELKIMCFYMSLIIWVLFWD